MKRINAMLLVCLLCWGLFGCGKENEDEMTLFLEKIKTSESTTQVELSELTDFEWEKLYIFAPYTSKSEIEEIVELSLKEVVDSPINDNEICMLFTLENENISYLRSKEEDLGIDFDFGVYDRYLCLENENSNLFSIENVDDICTLTYISD